MTVTDGNGDAATISATITQPAPIYANAAVTDVSCANGNNGAIDITVTGGTTPYTYLWSTSNGSGVDQTAEDQTGLTAGDYNLKITDDNGCTKDTTINVSQPDPITFGGSAVTDITRPQGENGAVDLNVHGGTPAYSYSWEGPSGFTSTEEDIDSLDVGGTYTVTVTDSHGCTGDTSFLVNDVTALIAVIDSVKDVSCVNSSDGYAHVTVTGGTGPYDYAWKRSDGSSVGGNSPSLPDVPAGTYYVTVTDQSDGRTASTSATIHEPDAKLSVVLSSVTHISCKGMNNGGIDITVSGGWLPYTYSWTGPAGYTANTEDVADLPPGYYSVTVTDASGCQEQLPSAVEITEPDLLTVTIQTNKEVLCYGDLNGELEALAAGGTGAYHYLWDDPGHQTTRKATYLEAGTYKVTVTDDNGCTAEATESLTQPDPLAVSAIIQDVSCPGQNDGSIILTPSGGTVPYNYIWTPGNETGKDLTDIPGGDYTVTLIDNHNCTLDSTFTVSEPETLVIDSVAVTDITGCPGNTNGKLIIYVSGGTPPYEYSTDGGSTFDSDSVFADLGAGDYQIAVKDAHGCGITGNIVTLSDPPSVTIDSISVMQPTCPAGADGQLIVYASGATPPYQYSLDDGTTWQNENTFSDLTAGNYTVSVKDANGCTVTGNTATLTDPPAVVIDNVIPVSVTCYGATDGSLTILASGSTRPYGYSVDGGTTFVADSVFSDLGAGNYDVAVRDAKGCITYGNTVALAEPEAITIVSTDVTATCQGAKEGTITVVASGGTGTLTYSLFSQEHTLIKSNTTGIFDSLDIGTYSIEVDDDNHCGPVASDDLQVPEATDCGLVIYNAFSPNGDGKNEVWNIRGIQAYPNCVVKVFNTWGNQVFSSKGYTQPWDGTYNGKTLPAGTYYYIIELEPGGKTYSGSVNIVK